MKNFEILRNQDGTLGVFKSKDGEVEAFVAQAVTDDGQEFAVFLPITREIPSYISGPEMYLERLATAREWWARSRGVAA